MGPMEWLLWQHQPCQAVGVYGGKSRVQGVCEFVRRKALTFRKAQRDGKVLPAFTCSTCFRLQLALESMECMEWNLWASFPKKGARVHGCIVRLFKI